jgi:hypothetical protein
MWFSLRRWTRDWRLRRRAGLRTWTRPLGDGRLTAEAEAWIRQIEDQLRIAESRLSGQLTRRSRPERAPGPDLWRLTARQVRLSRGLYPSDGNRRLATRRSLTSPE